jgi:hypothetical protein
MEKYQKTICLFILLAFFTALGFYVQKTTEALVCYLSPLTNSQDLQKNVVEFIFTQVMNVIP